MSTINNKDLMLEDIKKIIKSIIIIGTTVLISSLILLRLSLKITTNYNKNYTHNSNIDYNVFLKPNNFYETSYLPKNKQYIATLIDYIDMNFNYTFKSYLDSNLEYTYYIKATTLIDNLQGKNIYKNEKTLTNKKPFTSISNDTFTISENAKINYTEYNNLATNFINNYGINANSKVVISLYIDVLGKNSNIGEKAVAKLEIPLTNKNTDITINSKLVNTTNDIKKTKSTIINYPVLFLFALIIGISDIIIAIAILIYTIKKCDIYTLYSLKLKKILKDYDRYISETAITESLSELLNNENTRVEIVKSFDNLINIRESIEKPILYHEEKPKEEALFYLIDDKTTYIYIMHAEDMKKNK